MSEQIQSDIEYWQSHRISHENGIEVCDRNLGRLALEQMGQMEIDLYPPREEKKHDQYTPLGNYDSVAHGDDW